MHVDSSNRYGFWGITVYAPFLTGQPDFFRRLEVFFETSRFLLLVGVVWNSILDTHLNYEGRNRNRKGINAANICTGRFQLFEEYRLDQPNVPLEMWYKRIGSSYQDRVAE